VNRDSSTLNVETQKHKENQIRSDILSKSGNRIAYRKR